MTKKVSPGQNVLENTLFTDPRAINQTLETVDYFQRNLVNGGGPKPPIRNLAEPCIVKVQNNTGGNLARGKVLQLGTLLLTDLETDYLWFNADTPSGNIRKCAILRKPIPDGRLGEAQIAGVCIASVNVGNTGHTHASPATGSNDLASGMSGLWELLSPPDGTGVQEMAVRWCAGSNSIIRGRTNASHAKGASGTIRIYNGDTDTGETISAVNDYVGLDAEKKCHAALDANGIYYLIAGECL